MKMQQNNWIWKAAAFALTGVLCVSSIPMQALAAEATNSQTERLKNPEAAKDADGENTSAVEPTAVQKADVEITTVEEFLAFAKKCRMAGYSEGLSVYLKEDLDLSALEDTEEFSGITSFSGTFYGNGHVISNLHLTQGSEAIGLFRYLERGAMVRELTVTGTIECSDGQNKCGGIVGINAGTVRNCNFKGAVSCVGITGGIVGMNGTGGSVVRCNTKGLIESAHTVGGIVGYNCGVVTDCTNDAAVNSESSWLELEDDKEISFSLDSLTFAVKEDLEEGSDFGGIAGYSDGIIAGCKNKAVIGFLHTGRNVGGIVGRQSGEIIRCENEGRVYGKQDVGGIVGQFEPRTTLEDAEEISAEVEKLHDLMNQMIDDMEVMTDDLHTDFSALNDGTSDAVDTADALVVEIKDVIEKNIDVINDLAGRIDYATTHFSTVMTYVNQALDTVDSLLDDLDAVREDLDISGQMGNEEYDAAKNMRLVMRAGAGGSLETDNQNPAKGQTVTITIKPDSGYTLQKLTYIPYQKAAVDVTAAVTGNHYSFVMPEENVTLEAVFSYTEGCYIASSNPGGRVALSETDTQVKVKVLPEDGYSIQSLKVDQTDITGTLVAEGNGAYYTCEILKSDYDAGTKQVQAVFAKNQNSHTIDLTTGAGGSVSASPSAAQNGETVALTVQTLANYKLQTLTVKDAADQVLSVTQTGEKEYSFVMPDSDVTAEAVFEYVPGADTRVYVESNAGGNVTGISVPGSNDYRVTIVPDSRHELADSGTVMQITDDNGVVRDLDKQDLTENAGSFSYILDKNNYTLPAKVFVSFTGKAGISHAVTCVSSTGGTLAASQTTVMAGDTLKIAVANEAHYALQSLELNGGANVAAEVENGIYEYTVPDSLTGELEIAAQFRPVTIIVRSTGVGGDAAYSLVDGKVHLVITADTGYALKSFTLKNADGTEIVCEKKYADSDVYEFASEAVQQTAYLDLAFEKQNNKETVEKSKDELESQTDDVVESVDHISATADRMKEILTDEYGEAKNPEDLTDDEIEELSNSMLDMMGYLSDAGVAAGGVLGNVNTIIKVTGPYVEDAAENTDSDLEQLSTDARAMNDSLKSAGKEMKSIVDYLNALDELRAVNLSKQFDKNTDLLKDQLDRISDILHQMDNHLDKNSEKLEADMHAVNDQLNNVFQLLLHKIDNLENMANGEDIMEDRSAENPEESDASKVSNCTNDGVVKGDRNVGGIAGNIGVEGTDSGDDTPVSVGNKYITRAVLRDCTNNGFIRVKNENAGGIAGTMAVGYVADCVGNGRVSSETGNYLGGIAGNSAGTIDHCSVTTVLSGGKYLGGIAGKAQKITHCYAMPTILEQDGFVGAIAGLEEAEDTQEADITIVRNSIRDRIADNYYVSSKLYGINGVSYAGVAEPITYEELIAKADAPKAFRELGVTFLDAEDNVVGRTPLNYGDSLTELDYPDMITKDGDYMEWEGFDGDILEGNVVIQAVSTSNVTILSATKKEGSKPVVLVEGVFTEDAYVEVEEYAGALPTDVPTGSTLRAYRIALKQTKLSEDALTRIRLLNGEKQKAYVYQLQGDTWVKLDSKKAGSYEQVDMTGTEGIYCMASWEKETNIWLIVLIAICVAVICLLVIVIICMRRKMPKEKKPKEEQQKEKMPKQKMPKQKMSKKNASATAKQREISDDSDSHI